MKYSNFKLLRVIGSSILDYKFVASIDVTTGIFFKKTVTKRIFREYTGSWFFAETGKYTYSFEAEDLERAYRANNEGKELFEMDLEDV